MRACKLYLLREKGKMGKGGAQVNRAATRSQSREGRRKRMRKKWNPVQYLCPFSLKKMQRNHYRKVQFAPSSPILRTQLHPRSVCQSLFRGAHGSNQYRSAIGGYPLAADF